MKPLKVAVIGGGSTYTPELIDGFARYYDELPVENVILHDIDAHRLEIVGGLSQRMLQKTAIAVHTTTVLPEALDGADFVITQLRVGGLAARALDERIPMEHGVIGQETTHPPASDDNTRCGDAKIDGDAVARPNAPAIDV